MKQKTALKVGITMVIVLVATMAATPILQQTARAVANAGADTRGESKAPVAVSGENVYTTWWTNKTANNNEEVMFRASTDAGTTFSDKINLSNTTGAESQDAEIAAEGDSVFVSWWETNQTSDTPVARISTDAGQTFGPMLMLAANGTLGEAKGIEEGG
jgi:hypothetical protein